MILEIIHNITAALAVAALCISLYRLWQGPTIIDRNIATDVLSAGMLTFVAVVIIGWNRPDLAVVLIIIALTAFLSSLVVARYIRREVATSSAVLAKEADTSADDDFLDDDELVADDEDDPYEEAHP